MQRNASVPAGVTRKAAVSCARETRYATDKKLQEKHFGQEKERDRLNCIAYLQSQVPYEDLTPDAMKLEPHVIDTSDVRPPITDQTFVPEIYSPSLEQTVAMASRNCIAVTGFSR